MTNLVVAGNTIQRQSFGRHDAQICGRLTNELFIRKILFIQRWRRNSFQSMSCTGYNGMSFSNAIIATPNKSPWMTCMKATQ